MQPDDLEFACRRVGQEGWRTETGAEFEAYLEHDPLGCFVAEESQRPLGLCISVAYGAVGFMGDLIVLPSHRRIGIGLALCERALRYLKDQGAESIFLEGDENAIPMYERFGFRKLFRRPRFAGPVAYGSDRAVRGMLAQDLPQVESLDRDTFGADRSFFLRRSFALYPELCAVLEDRGQILGFVMGHPGSECVAVGPWIASPDLVRPGRLIEGLTGTLRGTTVSLGALGSNARATHEAHALGLEESGGGTWRMVRGPAGHLEDERWVLAIGSPARG